MLLGQEHGADGHVSVPGRAGVVAEHFPLDILVKLVYGGHFGTFDTFVGCIIRLMVHAINTAANCA